MLPPGHIAGSYLTSLTVAAIFSRHLPELGNSSLIAFGTFMGFAPDLDFFYKFSKVRKMYFDAQTDNKQNTHRRFISHAPLLYLLIGLIGFAAGHFLSFAELQAMFVMFVVGSWTHFLLDSSGYGIRWLWPLSKKLYSFYGIKDERLVEGKSFWQYWRDFLKYYARRPEPYLEAAIIVLAFIVVLTSKF